VVGHTISGKGVVFNRVSISLCCYFFYRHFT
jgi:hypothetical protein